MSLRPTVSHKCLTKPQSTNVNTIEEVNAVLTFMKSPHNVQAKLSDNSLDAMYICTVNTSKPKRRVFADLQLATQSSKPNTVMHDHSKAEVLGSVTIPILKDNQKHGITFQVVPSEASTLL